MVLIHIKANLPGFRFDAVTLSSAEERRRSRLTNMERTRIMTEASRLPVKTEAKGAAPATPAAWSPFEALRREIDRAFDTVHLGNWRLPLHRTSLDMDFIWMREGNWALSPAVDVSEKPSGYEISAEMPGIDEKDIEVKLTNGMLTIKGEKKEEKEEHDKDYYLAERRYGSFMRSFPVPDGVDTAKIEASFTKGVLTVKLPKSAEAQKGEKKISIKAA